MNTQISSYFCPKHKNKCENIWKLREFFLSLHRQNISYGYPVIPRGASQNRHYSILKATFGWLFIFHTSS